MYSALIVDDEPLMLEGMRLMVDWERCGFTLAGEAATAQEALKLIDTLKPDLLVTDLKMPGMLGTDLAQLCRRYHPQMKLVFFSGYRDFAFAQAAIQTNACGYLLKPIDPDEVHRVLLEVKAALDERQARETSPTLRSHTLRRIASGDWSDETLARAASLLSLAPDTPCYCVALELEGRSRQDDITLDGTSLGGLNTVAFHLSAGQTGLCVKADEVNEPLLQAALLKWEKAHGKRPRAGVGRVYRGAEGFAQSLQQAQDALETPFETHGSLCLFSPCTDEVIHWLKLSGLATLAPLMDKGDEEALEKWLTALRRNAALAKPSMSALRYMARQTEPPMLNAMARHGGDGSAINPLKELWYGEIADVDAWLDSYCTRVRDAGALRRVSTEQPPAVKQVLEMVESEYRSDLSITELAGRLYLNPAYLGQMVRKATGVTFNRHLTRVRLEHACQLLRQTRLSVREIASEVGVRDVNYFSTQFRREFAMSPNAYRGLGGAEGERSE